MADFMFQNVAYRATVYRTGKQTKLFNIAVFELNRTIWQDIGPIKLKVNQKIAFFGFEMDFFRFSISGLEPKFGNPSFDTPEKQNVFNFQLTFSQQFLIYSLFLYKPQQWNLEFATYFSVIVFWCSAAKEGYQYQFFKTCVLTLISGVSKFG